MSIGYGTRHPALVELLDRLTPVEAYDVRWLGGTLPLRLSAYVVDEVEVPDDLVISVRCVVEAAGQIVVCRNTDETHALPGGRREPGESFEETVVREVYEETGWHLLAETLRPLGFIHLGLLAQPPPGYRYPHPDTVQLVYGGRADRADFTRENAWSDTAGWELESFLVGKDAVVDLGLTRISMPFLRAYLQHQ